MSDWITVKELAQIQGITPRAVRKSIAQEKYITREVEAQNGIKYEIFVPSLNSGLQNLIDFEKYRRKNDKNAEPEMIKMELYPPHAKKIALARYDLVRLWVDYKNNSKKKTDAGKDFIFIYNKGEIYPDLFKILKTVSIGTIYRWAKAVKANNDYTSLIPDYDYSNGEYNVNLTREEELVFKSLFGFAMQGEFIADKYRVNIEIKSFDDIILKETFPILERFKDFELQDEDYNIFLEIYNIETGNCVYKDNFIFMKEMCLNMQVAGKVIEIKDKKGNTAHTKEFAWAFEALPQLDEPVSN
jgi:hypothetical protein